MGISFIAMWQLYKESGIVFNFWYFLSLSMVFTIGLTIFSVPFVAMGYEMTDDFHERTKIMASAQFIGSGHGLLCLGHGYLFMIQDFLLILNQVLES